MGKWGMELRREWDEEGVRDCNCMIDDGIWVCLDKWILVWKDIVKACFFLWSVFGMEEERGAA